jgi:hypothetical protein
MRSRLSSRGVGINLRPDLEMGRKTHPERTPQGKYNVFFADQSQYTRFPLHRPGFTIDHDPGSGPDREKNRITP